MTSIYVAGLTKAEALAVVNKALIIMEATPPTPSCCALWDAAETYEISNSRADMLCFCYRSHSQAKNEASGFHDISPDAWEDMDWTDKFRLRLKRLQAFRQAIVDSKWEE